MDTALLTVRRLSLDSKAANGFWDTEQLFSRSGHKSLRLSAGKGLVPINALRVFAGASSPTADLLALPHSASLFASLQELPE